MTSAKRRSEFGEASEMTSAKHRSEFGEASEMTSAKRGSTVFGETSERVRRSFGVPFSASVGGGKVLHRHSGRLASTALEHFLHMHVRSFNEIFVENLIRASIDEDRSLAT